MDEHDHILPEHPIEVDVTAIEGELSQFWKRAGEPVEGETTQPVVRACSMNLVVVSDDEARSAAMVTLVGEVTEEHPGRIFLVTHDRPGDPPSIGCWISTRCSLPVPGRSMVCCEEIMLHAVGRASERVPSIVISLLVADVPTVVLWKKGVEEANAVLTGILSITDRMLIDSSEEHRPETTLLTLARMVSVESGRGSHPSPGSCVTFCDLAWTHLTVWRLLLAQMFHPPEMRPLLDKIATVHIEYTATSSPRHSGCSQSLLLVAWLAARLQWKANAGLPAARHGHYTFIVRAATQSQRDITLSIDQVDATGVCPGGMTSIAVTTTSGRRLALDRREDQEAIRSVTEHNGTKEEAIVATMRRETESDLVTRELEVMERDAVYEETMNMLQTLLLNTLQ